MNFQTELLKTALGDLGLKEIEGRLDHPKIELAHKISKVEGKTDRDYTDEIPWCASMMGLWILLAGAKINPGRVYNWLKLRGFGDTTMSRFQDFFYKANPTRGLVDWSIDTGIIIPEPTWEGAALSYRSWGKPVESGKEQIGDIAVFTRGGAGKGHVAIFLRKGWVFITVLGANQSNKVCEADTYLRSKLVGIRRYTL